MDEDKDEFSDEACLFLAEYYKGRGEWKIAEEYTGQILHLEVTVFLLLHVVMVLTPFFKKTGG